MNAMLEARIVVERTHGSAPRAHGARARADSTTVLSHGNEAMELK
jgi:hypothetical protein